MRNNKKLLFTCWAISLMTILQIVSSYLKQLLQGSVNATLGRFCCVFCPRKEVCRTKSCSMWLSHQLVRGGRVRNGISVMSRPGPEDGSRHRCRLGTLLRCLFASVLQFCYQSKKMLHNIRRRSLLTTFVV